MRIMTPKYPITIIIPPLPRIDRESVVSVDRVINPHFACLQELHVPPVILTTAWALCHVLLR